MQKHWDGMVRPHLQVRSRVLILKSKNWQSCLGNSDFMHT